MKKLTLTVILSALLVSVTAGQGTEPTDIDGLTKELLEKKDDANSDLIRRLANLKTPESLDALIQVYDAMLSIYMRRVVVHGLVLYDDVDGADQTALQKLMEVATNAKASELRREAIEGLGRSQVLGRQFLERIVDSPADDGVRVQALRVHAAGATDDDHEWYLRLFEGGGRTEEKRGARSRWGAKAASADRELEVHSVPELRAVAFGVVAVQMSVRKLLQVHIDDLPEAETIFSRLMGDEVEPRRQFIQDNALKVRNLDV